MKSRMLVTATLPSTKPTSIDIRVCDDHIKNEKSQHTKAGKCLVRGAWREKMPSEYDYHCYEYHQVNRHRRCMQPGVGSNRRVMINQPEKKYRCGNKRCSDGDICS